MRTFMLQTVLLTLASVLLIHQTASAEIAIGISATAAPPPIPTYQQPMAAAEGSIWTPGYWAWADGGYYWVPGTWVVAPQVGYLWTPPWWGWGNGVYVFHEGYWGPHVGFYGGINYGFGYSGSGYEGGRWEGGHFAYNRSVTNVNVSLTSNVYSAPATRRSASAVGYNGGSGGSAARPTRDEEQASRERHLAPVASQTQHLSAARSNPQLRASANHGRPSVAATSRPAEVSGPGSVPAKAVGTPARPEERNTSSELREREDQQRAQPSDEAQRESGEHRGEESRDTQSQHERESTHSERHAAPSHHHGGGHRR